MLIVPQFNNYTLPQTIQFIKDFVKLTNDENGDKNALTLDNYIALVNRDLKPLDAAYAYQKDSPQSKELIAFDDVRDNDLVGIRLYAEAHIHHYDPTLQEAAHVVLNCFNNFGKKIHSMAYAIETEVVDKLVTALQTDSIISAAVAILNLTAWVAHLKDTNNSFNSKYIERTKEYAGKPAQSATELKKPAIASFAVLEQQLNSVGNPSIDITGKYATLIGHLNALISQYNSDAAKRLASNASAAAKKTDNNNTSNNS